MFKLFPVDKSWAESSEPLGTKPKFWYRDDKGRHILFKAEERGTGEHWAEKLACELCRLIGLPHVHYELADEFDGSAYIQPGVICENFAAPPLSLVLGSQLLLATDPDYPADERRRYKVSQHTVEAVSTVVEGLALPPEQWRTNLPSEVSSSLGVFIGYLMLDAWIANQDRHHENWAAVREGNQLWLAPTFDHGASMARNESDALRKERMTTKDRNRQIPAYAAKARSAIYMERGDEKSLLTIEAFQKFAELNELAATAWLDRLSGVDRSGIKAIIDEVPPKCMSRIAKQFTLELLIENQNRLVSVR